MAGRMPGLATQSLGGGLGRPRGEGGGLPLASPPGLLKFGLEPFHLGAQLVNSDGPGGASAQRVPRRWAAWRPCREIYTRGLVRRHTVAVKSGQRPGNQILLTETGLSLT